MALRLDMTDHGPWQFVNGPLVDDEHGPAIQDEARRSDGDGIQGHHYAFRTDCSYSDFDARVAFTLGGHSDAGLIFHAASPSDFWVLHFPDCGQASRAEHFWATVSRMDGDGWLRIVHMELVRRVSSTSSDPHTAEVGLHDGRLRVTIDRTGVFEFADDGLRGSGAVGLYLFGAASFGEVDIDAEPEAAGWDSSPAPARRWFHPCPDDSHGKWQRPTSLFRSPGGDLVLQFVAQEQPYRGALTSLHIRSQDDGRTWSAPEPLVGAQVDGWEGGYIHVCPDGALRTLMRVDDGFAFAATEDDGRTWSEPTPCSVHPLPQGMPKLHAPPAPLVSLDDGGMLLFAYGGHESSMTDSHIRTWGAHHCSSFVCRSDDNGRTWSAWTSVDGTEDSEGHLDLTETCAAQASDGRIMTLTRPIYSPWMWESWSEDGGRTWSPCVRGPFPGYATSNMLRTASGALLVAHRSPGCTLNASFDGGITWDAGTMVDSAIWVMGSMAEVAPDRVLYIYWDSFESKMRGQFFDTGSGCVRPVDG